MLDSPAVLSLAGFDPSGGAGVLADVKTIEFTGATGLAVITALTHQSHWKFKGVQWLSFEEITNQLEPLLLSYNIKAVKIGLVQNFDQLHKLIQYLKNKLPEAILIWDPILKASAGYDFHEKIDSSFFSLCDNLNLITPNYNEVQKIGKALSLPNSAHRLSQHCDVLVTSESLPTLPDDASMITDSLYQKGVRSTFPHAQIKGVEKHGSGCVFSSTLATSLALGKSMTQAIEQAQKIIKIYLKSDSSLVGHFPSIESLPLTPKDKG